MESSPVSERLLYILQAHLRIHPFNSALCSNSHFLTIKEWHDTALGEPAADRVVLRLSRGSAAHLVGRGRKALEGSRAIGVRQQVHQQRVDAVQRLRPFPVPHLPGSRRCQMLQPRQEPSRLCWSGAAAPDGCHGMKTRRRPVRPVSGLRLVLYGVKMA